MDEINKPCGFLLEKESIRFNDITKSNFNQLNAVRTKIKKMEKYCKSDELDKIIRIIDSFIYQTKSVIPSNIDIEERIPDIIGEIEIMLLEGGRNNIKILPLNSELESDYYVTHMISEFIRDTLINAVTILNDGDYGTVSIGLRGKDINKQTYVEIHISITGCEIQSNIYDYIFDFRKSKYGGYGFWFAQQLLKILDGDIIIAENGKQDINFAIVLPGYNRTIKEEEIKKKSDNPSESIIKEETMRKPSELQKTKVFISYATEDYNVAKNLYDDLIHNGIIPWLDKKDLLLGQNWRITIPHIIKNSSYFLLLISANSVSKTGYLQKEQKIALELLDEKPSNEIFIIPVRIDNTEPIDEKLKNLHWADLSDYNKGLEQVLKTLKLGKEETHEKQEQNFNSNELLKNPIRILHLSDLHIKKDIDPLSLYQPLFTDMEDEVDGLGIQKIDYLIITGDLTNRASPEEFEKAAEFIKNLKDRYSIADDRCIIVPGNHDLNWDEEVYDLKKRRALEVGKLEKGKYVEEGNIVLVRKNDKEYSHRFRNFSGHFYRMIMPSPYPLPFEDQCIPFLFTKHRILILAMNSSWEIDEYFKERSGIHGGALARGLLQADNLIKQAKETGNLAQGASILKIAAWHHPVTGNEKIENDAFLERLRQVDFKLCLHGHVHEDRADIVGYTHPTRQIRIVGAGSFDAPGSDRPESIPRLYNLIEISPDHSIIRVNTRCKRKDTGAWTGYAVWPGKDRHSKQAYYEIDLQ